MKTICITLLCFVSTLLQSQTKATLSEKQQTLTWIGKAAVGGYAPEGTLEILQAEITFTSEEILELTIEVDMTSLEQENTQLRDHLLEEDFFYVEKYPKATFALAEPAQLTKGNATLVGSMTIRGKTQTEVISATVEILESQILISFEHSMDRTRYGVNHNSPSLFKRLKENAIADDFVLKGRLVFQN